MKIKDMYKEISYDLNKNLGINIQLNSDNVIRVIQSDQFKLLLDRLNNSNNYRLFNSSTKDVDNTLYKFYNNNLNYYVQLIGDFYNRSYRIVISFE